LLAPSLAAVPSHSAVATGRAGGAGQEQVKRGGQQAAGWWLAGGTYTSGVSAGSWSHSKQGPPSHRELLLFDGATPLL